MWEQVDARWNKNLSLKILKQTKSSDPEYRMESENK